MGNWRELCSVVHKGSPSFAVMREDGHLITAYSFDELIEAVKTDAKVKLRSKNNIVWITRNGKKIPIRAGRLPNGQRYVPQVGSEIVVRGIYGGSIKYIVTGAEDFRKEIYNAKKTLDPKDAWRVDDTHQAKDFKKATTYTTQHGSTVAIKQNGDIISVCKKQGDIATGSDLLKLAVANGGKKLDSFSKNYKFYVDNGFEPVSWTPFNKKYAPHDWVEGRDKQEPIIFFKYTGKKSNLTRRKFLKSVEPYAEYGDAAMARDRSM